MSRKIMAIVIVAILLSMFSTVISAEHRITDGISVIEAEHFDAEFPLQIEICNNEARDDAPEVNYNVGYINPGDFLQFTVYVEVDGVYRFDAWLASRNEDMPGSIVIYVQPISNVPQEFQRVGIASPSQTDGAGWQVWYLETVGEVNLTAGMHVIRTEFPFGAVNFDAFVITRVGDMSDDVNTTVISEPNGGADEVVVGRAEVVTLRMNTNENESLLASTTWAAIAVIALAVIAVIIFFAARKRIV